jgi:hypothetical protein
LFGSFWPNPELHLCDASNFRQDARSAQKYALHFRSRDLFNLPVFNNIEHSDNTAAPQTGNADESL